MASEFPCYQLPNGLMVSGHPEPPKVRAPTMGSVPIPYTGGDVNQAGELGKMFDIPLHGPKHGKSGPKANAPSWSHSQSGSRNPARPSYSAKKSSSGPLSKHGEPIRKSFGSQSSGAAPPALPVTGLITSGPVSSGPLNSSGGALNPSRSSSVVNIPGATTVGQADEYTFKRNIPMSMWWCMFMILASGFLIGGFTLRAANNYYLLIAVGALLLLLVVLFLWNTCWWRKAVVRYITRYPDSELRTAENGQHVKLTGLVTCGGIHLRSSFQKFPRCVYTCTSLYEYRGRGSRPANPNHHLFTWGLRHTEKHAVDFYISDFKSGIRALVKTGHGSQVTPYVDEAVAIEFDHSNKDSPPPRELTQWLAERNLSSDDRRMRLKEGCIQEGSTVSVMGVVQKNDNVLMIVPPSDPFITPCQWIKCLLPSSLDGIVLRAEDTSNLNVIAV